MAYASQPYHKQVPSPAPSSFQQSLDYYAGQAEPQMAQLDLQNVQNKNHLGYLYASNDLATGQYGKERGFVNQGYGLDMESLGLQKGAVGIDTDYQNKVQALAQGLLDVNLVDINNQSDAANRNQMSQATAAGAVQSKNNITNLADILTQRNVGISKAKNAFAQTQASITRAKELNENQLAQLDITAKQLGLSRDKTLSAINDGLKKLNLDTTMSASDLYAAITSGDLQRQQLGYSILNAATAGYGSGQFGYDPKGGGHGLDADEQWIIKRESGGRTSAKNPKSSAFGLGQLIVANRRSYAKRLGIKDPNTTNYDDQLRMFRLYVKERYGTAANAKRFWLKHGWY